MLSGSKNREDLLREETFAPAWRFCLCSAVPSLLLKELDVEVLGFSSSPGKQVLLCLLFHAASSISLGYFTLRAEVPALAMIQYTGKKVMHEDGALFHVGGYLPNRHSPVDD